MVPAKTLERKNKYPYWEKEKRVLVCGGFCDYHKRTPLSIEKELYIYLPGQLLWTKITKVLAIARTLNCNRLG